MLTIPTGWVIRDEILYRDFRFTNFSKAWAFMNRVALVSEVHNHHPDWRNVWNRVEISLCTHDQGNTITDKDIELANAINLLVD
jgi:4a-hydroxytetrahydrobiopterin dehydratase